MLYLIWGLLNIGLLIYFLIICYKVIKIVREKMGLLATVFFIVVLLSLIGSISKDSYNKATDSKKTETWNNTSEDSLFIDTSYLPKIELENNLVTSYYLFVFYGKNKNNYLVPESAYTAQTGFVAGTKWTPMMTSLYRTNDKNKYSYSVYGIVHWKLLGIPIYTQQKKFKGTILTKKTD